MRRGSNWVLSGIVTTDYIVAKRIPLQRYTRFATVRRKGFVQMDSVSGSPSCVLVVGHSSARARHLFSGKRRSPLLFRCISLLFNVDVTGTNVVADTEAPSSALSFATQWALQTKYYGAAVDLWFCDADGAAVVDELRRRKWEAVVFVFDPASRHPSVIDLSVAAQSCSFCFRERRATRSGRRRQTVGAVCVGRRDFEACFFSLAHG